MSSVAKERFLTINCFAFQIPFFLRACARVEKMPVERFFIMIPLRIPPAPLPQKGRGARGESKGSFFFVKFKFKIILDFSACSTTLRFL